MIPREIETERLRLRQFTEDDLKPMAKLNSMHEVTQYMGYGVIGLEETWQQVATILGHWQMRGYGPYAVDDKATGGFVGRIGPWYPIDWPDFEVGWMLLKNSARAAWAKRPSRRPPHCFTVLHGKNGRRGGTKPDGLFRRYV